ncbi:unnamed protein product [Effrenium voratum]|nr:unnamed protein product [Effrenium voratum]
MELPLRISLRGFSLTTVELHLELENRSSKPVALPLGLFTVGTCGSTALAAGLQSVEGDEWRSAKVLRPRNYPQQPMAIFLPPWQAVKMPIHGKVMDTGRFGGSALCVGGECPKASEVLLPLEASRQRLRFCVEGCTPARPAWVGPYEPKVVPKTWEGRWVSEPCDLLPEQAPKIQARTQALQHCLAPELPVPRHHEVKETPQEVAKPASRGFRSRRFRPSAGGFNPKMETPALLDDSTRPNSEEGTAGVLAAPAALADEEEAVTVVSREEPEKRKKQTLPSLTVLQHGTTWRKLSRKLDVFADPILLELAEGAASLSPPPSALALVSDCFQSRMGQRFADALRCVGYKVLLGENPLTSWAAAREDSNSPEGIVLLAHWRRLASASVVQQVLRGAVVLCDHQDEAAARAQAKLLPCRWRVMSSVIFD